MSHQHQPGLEPLTTPPGAAVKPATSGQSLRQRAEAGVNDISARPSDQPAAINDALQIIKTDSAYQKILDKGE